MDDEARVESAARAIAEEDMDVDQMFEVWLPTTTANPAAPGPKKHPHVFVLDPVQDDLRCSGCPARRTHAEHAALQRRNRANAKRGKAIQRQRIVGLGGQNLPGNKPNHDGIGLAFSYESKSGGFFSERVWRVLTGIPRTAAQSAVLIVTDTPGPGHKARSYVVVEYDEWRDLHGETL